MRFRFVFVAALLLTSHTSPVTAQTSISQARVPMGNHLINLSRRMLEVEIIRENALTMFDSFEADGVPGLSQADLDIESSRNAARVRANQIGQMLRHDLNADLQVTEDELRITQMERANRPLRSGQASVNPTAEQIESILIELVAQHMQADVNGDRVISFDEITASADASVAQTRSREQRPTAFPGGEADLDKDGLVSRQEYLQEIDAILSLMDKDADGRISADERNDMRAVIQKAGSQPLVALPAPAPAFTAIWEKCVMPDVPEGAEVAMLAGYEGSALTDIYFGATPSPVQAIDLHIPGDGPKLYLIASFYDDTLIRVSGNAARLANVVSTRGDIGLTGVDGVTPVAAPPECHLEPYGPVSDTSPDPRAFFADRLGYAPITVIAGYTIGSADLGTGQNDSDGALKDAVPDLKSPAWERFHRYNPGGLIRIDAQKVSAAEPVHQHTQLPQWAGVASLVDAGTLIAMPGANTGHEVREDDQGRIRIGAKTFHPGFGDDAISVNNLVYTEERPRIWIGREPTLYLGTEPFAFPAGLTGAHALYVLIPDGMERPGGAPGHSKVQVLERGDIRSDR